MSSGQKDSARPTCLSIKPGRLRRMANTAGWGQLPWTRRATLPLQTAGQAQSRRLSIDLLRRTDGGRPLGTTESEVLIKQGGAHRSIQSRIHGRLFEHGTRCNGLMHLLVGPLNHPEDGTRVWATWIASLRFPNCR